MVGGLAPKSCKPWLALTASWLNPHQIMSTIWNITRILYGLMHFWCRDDFTAYANVCFHEFGDRVTHWTTMLEPNIMAQGGFDTGDLPPNHCSYPFGSSNCTVGNSTTEPYLFVHHSLLTHASTVRLYRHKYQVRFLLWWLLFSCYSLFFFSSLRWILFRKLGKIKSVALFSISGCPEGHHWPEFVHNVALSIHRFGQRHWSNW
jgi:hypothetical protein